MFSSKIFSPNVSLPILFRKYLSRSFSANVFFEDFSPESSLPIVFSEIFYPEVSLQMFSSNFFLQKFLCKYFLGKFCIVNPRSNLTIQDPRQSQRFNVAARNKKYLKKRVFNMSKNRSSKKNTNVKCIPQNALCIGHPNSRVQSALCRMQFALGIKTYQCKVHYGECKVHWLDLIYSFSWRSKFTPF